jgi:hypothetical protein
VDLFNGMQMGGQWDWNRRTLRIGVAPTDKPARSCSS